MNEETRLAFEQQLCDMMADLIRANRPRLLVGTLVRVLIAFVFAVTLVGVLASIIIIIQMFRWRSKRIGAWKRQMMATRERGRPFFAHLVMLNSAIREGHTAPALAVGCEDWGLELEQAVYFGDVVSKFGSGPRPPEETPFEPMLDDERFVHGRKRPLDPELCGGHAMAAYDVIVQPRFLMAPVDEWPLIPYMRVEMEDGPVTMQIPAPVLDGALKAVGVERTMYSEPALRTPIMAMIMMGLTRLPIVPPDPSDPDGSLRVLTPGQGDPVA